MFTSESVITLKLIRFRFFIFIYLNKLYHNNNQIIIIRKIVLGLLIEKYIRLKNATF